MPVAAHQRSAGRIRTGERDEPVFLLCEHRSPSYRKRFWLPNPQGTLKACENRRTTSRLDGIYTRCLGVPGAGIGGVIQMARKRRARAAREGDSHPAVMAGTKWKGKAGKSAAFTFDPDLLAMFDFGGRFDADGFP